MNARAMRLCRCSPANASDQTLQSGVNNYDQRDAAKRDFTKRQPIAGRHGGRDRSPAQSRQGHCRSVEGLAARPRKQVGQLRSLLADVRFWPKADIPSCTEHVPLLGVKRTQRNATKRKLFGATYLHEPSQVHRLMGQMF